MKNTVYNAVEYNPNNTRYEDLANAVFEKIKDVDLCAMSEATAYDIVIGYMKSAIVQFQSCKEDLSDRDDETRTFNFRLREDTFAILVNYMVICWLDANFILTTQSLKSRLTSSDFHSLQLSNQLGKAIELRDMLKSENDQLAINKSYSDSEIFDIVTKRGRVSR